MMTPGDPPSLSSPSLPSPPHPAGFNIIAQRYHRQLSIGCGRTSCSNRLCRSSGRSPRMTSDAIAILSLQLASRPHLFLCPEPDNDLSASRPTQDNSPASSAAFSAASPKKTSNRDPSPHLVSLPPKSPQPSSPAKDSRLKDMQYELDGIKDLDESVVTPLERTGTPLLRSIFSMPIVTNILMRHTDSHEISSRKSKLSAETNANCGADTQPSHKKEQWSAWDDRPSWIDQLASKNSVGLGHFQRTCLGMEPVSVGPLFAPYSRMLPTANSIHRNHGHPSSLSCFDLGKHSDPDNSSTEHSTEHSTSGSASWPGCVDGENTRSFSKTRHRPSDILTGANSISNQPNNSDSLDIDIRSNGIQDHAQKTPCCQSPIAADIPTLSLTDLKFAVSIYNLSENNEESAVHSIELERDGLTGLYWNSEKYQDFDTTDQKDSQSRKQTLARHMSAPCITDTMSAIDRESSSRSDTQANSNSRVDHHSLFTTLRQTFSSAEVLGSSFLVGPNSEQEPSEDSKLILPTTNVGGIDLDALRECYEVLIEIKPRTVFTIQVTNYMETLLAQLEQELSIRSMPWQEQHMRAILFLLMNPILFEQPYQETLLGRIIRLFISIPNTQLLIEWLSCLDEEGMAQLVTLLKLYLSAHFTPRPTGNHHPAVCAVNALSILYQANINDKSIKQRNSVPSSQEDNHHFDTIANSVISFRYFYSGVMEALNFKDEYQIWRSGWDKSPEDRFFSYFDYPFLLSPTAKSHVISLDALLQMSAHYEDACIRHALADHAQRLLPEDMSSSAHVFQMSIRAGSSPYLVLELGRERLVEEAFEQITKKHADLKKPLKVAFVDVGEEGMDQGGVTKEFFQLMVEKVFDSRFGLFTELDDGSHSWWFQGEFDGSSIMKESGPDSKTRLIEYELVGILVGLALYNGVILGVRFPSVVYRKLLGWDIGLGSFQESFPALGHGLDQMLQWNDGDVYDVFMRSFEISYEHLGHVSTIPLIPGGQDIPVTNENREEYVKAYIDHYVNQHISQEFEAFHRGFEKICGGKALKLLRPEELELLLCGNSDLDMHELEVNCLYDDGFSSAHPLIKSFWEIVHQELTAKQHKELLVFVTGSDRVPIRGLKDLLFVIQRNGPDSDRLPTALTCFSRLLLPEYSHRDKMKERLVTAIENSNGFGLV